MKRKNHFGNIAYLYRTLKLVLMQSRKYVFLKLFMVVYNSLSPLIAALITKEIIDILIHPVPGVWGKLLPFILASGILALVNISVPYYANKWLVTLEEGMRLTVNREIIYKLSRVPYSFYDDTEAYDRVEAASREVRSLPGVLDNIFNLLSAILTLILLVPTIAMFDIPTMLIILVFNVPGIFLQLRIRKSKFDVSKESVYLERCMRGVENMLVNKYYAGEVRIFRLFSWLYGKYQAFSTQLLELKKSSTQKHGKLAYGNNLLSWLLTFLLQIHFIAKVLAKAITLGEYTMYNAYVVHFNQSVSSVITCMMNLYEKELFLHNLIDFLEDDRLLLDAPVSETEKKTQPLAEEEHYRIDFEDVTFSYPKNPGQLILNHFNLTIEAGKTLAIVGLNGAGKTTIFNLILRFYSPNSGRILLNGRDIRDIPVESYWKQISVVFQEPKLYPFSLRENISFGAPESEEIQGHRWIEDIVRKFPKGMDTVILPYFDKSGIEPSHGQTQRIALARALSKSHSILLLDEPTSSMDPEIEYFMFRDFKEICQNKTCLIISHRLSSVTVADKIILLENGTVVESGTHSQLLNQNGEYARLFRMQSEKYLEQQPAAPVG